MRSESDNDLIAGIRACDPLALTALSRGGHVTIFRFALRLLRNEPSADDIVASCLSTRGAIATIVEGRSKSCSRKPNSPNPFPLSSARADAR